MLEPDDRPGSVRRSGGGGEGSKPHPDRTPLNWLLLPVLATLFPVLYNRRSPELFGVPFFYWYQLAAVLIGVACCYVVFRATAGGRR